MVLRINESFQGALGVALDTVNTSATGFSGTGTSVFDATIVANGTTSAQFNTAATLRLAQWTLTSQTVGYFSVYFTPQSIPAANTIILRVGTTPTVSAFTGNIQTTGKVKFGDSSGAIVESVTTDSVVIGELNRIDVTYNAGAIHMEFYPGNAQANNAVGTATAGNTKTGTTATLSYAYRAVGIGVSTTLVLNVDAFREDDTALPGPVGAVATPLTAAAIETDTLAAALVSGAAATAITAGLHLDVSNAAAATTMTLTAPSDVVPGALMWVQLSLGTLISVEPAGWTQVAAALVTSAPRLYAYSRVATAADPPGTTYVWTYGSATGSASIQTYFGVDTTTPVDAAATTAGNATAASSFPVAGAVTATAGALLLTGIATAGTVTTPVLTPPAGFTTRFDNVPKRHALADLMQAAAGNPGTLTWTVSASSAWTAYATALRPSVSAAVPTAVVGSLVETDRLTAAPASALAATLAATPSSGTVPFTVTATASTTGGTGTAKTYAWAWGDGATTVAGAAASVTHSYTTAGTYTVTVTVTATGSTAATATAPVQANVAGAQILYMRSGTTLVPARLGMRTGTTVTYLSP